jgi:hypothetical protein
MLLNRISSLFGIALLLGQVDDGDISLFARVQDSHSSANA